MEFRQVLRILDKLNKRYGPVSAEEFAERCGTRMPVKNARVYLLRLFKMNLASRYKMKDENRYPSRKVYFYETSDQGEKYLNYLDSAEYMVKQHDILKRMEKLIEQEQYKEAIDLYKEHEHNFSDETLKLLASMRYGDALHKETERLRKELGHS